MATTFHYIHKVGIELEGGWHRTPRNTPRQTRHSDCSVRVAAPYCGEVVSAPITTKAGVEGWLRRAYPNSTNSSCGLHIHISLRKREHYLMLASVEFVKAFTEWADNFAAAHPTINTAEFKRRAAGDNDYTQRMGEMSDPALTRLLAQQVHATSKDGCRYYHLNYCLSLHGTLECRLLPCFNNADDAVVAVNAYLTFVEGWLAANARKMKQAWVVEVRTDEVVEASPAQAEAQATIDTMRGRIALSF